MDTSTMRQRFRELHESGTFVIPNPWDVGSARVLEAMGFSALATTSSGFAASLGLPDQHVTRDQLVAHVAAICEAVDIPLNVDAERCYADDVAGVAQTIELLAAAGASGISIEDYDPATGAVDQIDVAVARVAAAAEACERHGITLTGRCENMLYGFADLDDTIERLQAYRGAGAHVAYAPGLMKLDDVARVVEAVPGPHNVLAFRKGPPVGELASVGVRRVSTGGSLAWAAYGGLATAAQELLDAGTSTYLDHALPRDIRGKAFHA
jgi:2-methylisocitrate lyase-like PEP mutase family enzyme